MSGIENIHPTIPSTDLDRAQDFYTGILGLELIDRDDYGLRLRNRDWMTRVFASSTAGTATHTAASFGVKDVRGLVDSLRDRGVTFEDYDSESVQTKDGIASFGSVSVAWFRDADDNILAISDGMEDGALSLADSYLHPTIPASNLDRARRFYSETLGLGPGSPDSAGHGVVYQLEKSLFNVYPSEGASSSDNTVAGFTVSGIEALVGRLKGQGVMFEDYDMPGIKTVEGIADVGVAKASWMRDTEGNLVALVQLAT